MTPADIHRFERDGFIDFFWRCGNATIERGQRIFLIRTGKGPRGVIGAGWAFAEPEDGYEDGEGEWSPSAVYVRFTLLSLQPFIDRAQLDQAPFDRVAWSNATAAARVPAEVVAALDARLLGCLPTEDGPSFSVVDPETSLARTGDQERTPPGNFVRTEGELMRRFVAFRRLQGVRLRAMALRPPSWPTALRCDLYDQTQRCLIVAKATPERDAVRMAIGQLADYARFLPVCEKAVLLPSQPHADLLDLMKSQSVFAIWEAKGAFVDTAGGRLVDPEKPRSPNAP
ncbi:MAG: hypothetical protein ABI629_02710 [bacterium]